MQNNNSFSRIEILIAVAVIIVLAFTSIPKFLDIFKKAEETATKKGLASLRSAISLYYGDNGGNYPDINIAAELVKKGYIEKIPYVYIPYHKKSNIVLTSSLANNTDTGGWAYKYDDKPDSTGRVKGQIWINCSHDDWSKL
ncbi:MAG: hypothetical protein LBT07_00990 [Endomicrobium sp.]|jgi:type II secretory pathway pseudopilin PulG|nr:hypothetical protein [Endomicrobium sp.]